MNTFVRFSFEEYLRIIRYQIRLFEKRARPKTSERARESEEGRRPNGN